MKDYQIVVKTSVDTGDECSSDIGIDVFDAVFIGQMNYDYTTKKQFEQCIVIEPDQAPILIAALQKLVKTS